MKRPFEFSEDTRQKAFFRQWNLCAHCGRNLINLVDHAHHVVPNQSGRAAQPNDAWIREIDNCVILCEQCHYRVHQNGSYQAGAVAPPQYFPYSNGREKKAHQAWANKLNKLFWGT